LKTKASRRRVDLPGELVAELRRWRLQCPPGAHDLVFPNGAGNPENYGNLLNRGFYPALRRSGLRKIRFHDLRHTFASLLIANGEHPKRIQALMGHSSINVTMDVYGHLMPGGGAEVADRLGALVFRGSGSKTVECDEIELAADAQVIVSLGARDGIQPLDQSMPTMAPVKSVARVPDRMDLGPSATISTRRSGTMVPRPPIRIPRLPKFAKPHSA
jgi:hypothetical protein